MIVLLAFAFLAGVVTVLSPCILPILPIVLSGSVGGGKKRPLGIILGFVTSFTFFTLFLTKIVQLTGIPSDTLRIVAAVVLLLFGISLLIPKFQLTLEKLFTKLSKFGPKANPHTGFWGGVVIGLSIGLIWTPCVGPILGSVIALAATSKVNTTIFLITFAYSLGSGIPMFFIMLSGRNLLNKAPILVKNGEIIQKAFGVLMIVMSFVIYKNLDIQFSNFIASTPYGANLTNLEKNDLVKQQLDKLKGSAGQNSAEIDSSSLFNENTPAPEFVGISKWLNPEQSLSIKDLRGKVVLVDFWTYTCINCIRTLPHVTSWYDKYKNQGFVVVGVHTPEFEFEKQTLNVQNAIKQYNIHYPVAQDNDYATWNNFNNQYWPAEYLIDAKGIIRRTHFGEGEYDQMEKAIQLLLKEAGQKVTSGLESMLDQPPQGRLTPETYLGSARMERNSDNAEGLPLHYFSLLGDWKTKAEYSQSGKNSSLTLHFYASKVFLVITPKKAGDRVKVFLDGKLNNVITLDEARLYDIVKLDKISDHTLRLEFENEGIQVFAFTFG